tara:strand:- start:378170 stop:378610 length:441 start_codon:yes stop_codon:yes gene_type:complete
MKLVIEPDSIAAGFKTAQAPEHQLLRFLANGDYKLLLSAPLLYAYEQSLYDNRHSLNLKFREIEEALSFIAERAEYVPCHALWHAVMNKPEKDLSVACAYIGGADALIVLRPDLYKQAKTTLNLTVLSAKKSLKLFEPPKTKRKAA